MKSFLPAMMAASLIVSTVTIAAPATAQKNIALTIDDLPFIGTAGNNKHRQQREHDRFMKVMRIIKKANIPAAGFVIAGNIEKGQWSLLEKWKNNGFLIANHSFHHWNLNHTQSDRYIRDVARADRVLSTLMPRHKKYFRYPFLAAGRNHTQKIKVRQAIKNMGYTIAPVTIDSKDYYYNAKLMDTPWRQRNSILPHLTDQYMRYIARQTQLAEKKARSNGRPHQAQILLIHMNVLATHTITRIIQYYKHKGYRFIRLEKALRN